jgi:hypothetical protein
MPEPKINIALPVMNEMERLPAFMEAIANQTVQDYSLVVCINQPDNWWYDPSKRNICENNRAALGYLRSLNDERITLIDRSTEGSGWMGKKHGIGWARKVIMDYISANAEPDDIILSLDADTLFGPAYLESILQNRRSVSYANAISVPYYHRLTGDEAIDRAMLRYEIYMRAFAVNLWRIQSPYSLTALGSAIALPVRAYKSIGGMTPKLSGEDFYFLQKLLKTGTVVHWNAEKVYPAARLSDRVFFGTGPALIKGIDGDWESYPIYRMSWFDSIRDTYSHFAVLFEKDVETPLDDFLVSTFGKLPWPELRANFKTQKHFIRACLEKIDGLRLLQYLKNRQRIENENDELSLLELIKSDDLQKVEILDVDFENFSFARSPLVILDPIRNYLEVIELRFRKEHYEIVAEKDIR